MTWAVVYGLGGFTQVTGEAKRLNIRYIARTTLLNGHDMIGCQRLCLSTTQTSMAVFRTQFTPLLGSIRTAVLFQPGAASVKCGHRMGKLLALVFWICAVVCIRDTNLSGTLCTGLDSHQHTLCLCEIR
jgi:hypothetical protein